MYIYIVQSGGVFVKSGVSVVLPADINFFIIFKSNTDHPTVIGPFNFNVVLTGSRRIQFDQFSVIG